MNVHVNFKIMKKLVILYFIVAVIGFGLWVRNLVKFIELDFKPSYKAEIIRGVGIVIPPVGVVVSLINIQDGPSTNP